MASTRRVDTLQPDELLELRVNGIRLVSNVGHLLDWVGPDHIERLLETGDGRVLERASARQPEQDFCGDGQGA
jgi:hypothetical protein